MDHIAGLYGKTFFGLKNLRDESKTGSFEFIEKLGGSYKFWKIKSWWKNFHFGLKNEQIEQTGFN